MAFTFESERQIQARILNKIATRLSLNDVNTASIVDILTQVVAQEKFAENVSMSQIINLVNVDNLRGTDLDSYSYQFGLERQQATKTTGVITVQRTSTFTKVSTQFYAGSSAPITGNTTIDVNDASSILISTSGTLVLGRGTSNEEDVTYSIAPIDNTNFYTFNLDAPLTKDHAIEETVILKQGSDENILAGSVVRVPATSNNKEIQFTVDSDNILYSGESELLNVGVTSVLTGTANNISALAIFGEAAFITPPFSGARAQNEAKFTTGLDRQSDDSLRDAIKNHIISLSRGTKQAILNAIVGLTDAETAQRVVSASVILPTSTNDPVKIYVDNGIGLEPTFSSQGKEDIIENSTGSESRLQLDLLPIVKAQLETNNAEQYNFSGGSKTLTYTIGLTSETITFQTSDFVFPESATAEEVVTAINNRSTLLEARTSQSGTKIVVSALVDENENIQVTGGTANTILGFPTDMRYTLYLYIDDVLKSKDGSTAYIDSQNSGPFDLAAIGGFPQDLTIIVDGKAAHTQTITFQAADFANTAAATAAEIVAVINAQLAGAVASVVNNNTQVRIISNTEFSASSELEVTGGTANDAGDGLNFDTTQVTGTANDYTFNKELGTIKLNTPLTINQSVTAGSIYTRAYLRAALPENYSPVDTTTLLIKVDGGGAQTITFDASFVAGKSATDTATFINLQLIGATAIVREIGELNYLEIRTNTYDHTGSSSIEITSASTGNAAFTFDLDTVATSQRPHQAFVQSGYATPYAFVENDILVLVMNDDIVNNTFSVPMTYSGVITTQTDTDEFRALAFANVFLSDDELNDFYLAFKTGANTLTVTGTIDTITRPGGNTTRYAFSGLPGGLNNFAAGDMVHISGCQDSNNDGDFVVTDVSVAGNGYIEISNVNGVVEAGSTASCRIGQRRKILDYTTLTGYIKTTAAFTNAPVVSEQFIVMPSTTVNVRRFLNNTKITSLSLKAVIEETLNATKVQISSKEFGSDGAVQVTGGTANDKLAFATTLYKGLEAYNYYTGLIALCHRTVYGDDTDLASYPGVGAAGITFQIMPPTVTEVEISVTLTLKEGVSISQVQNEVISAVTGYVNNLGVGQDIIIENIRAAIIKISGIVDVVLNDPSANVAVADNEIVRTRSSLITMG